MDVYGRKPKSSAGNYFRANVWSWRPIHDLLKELCSDLLPEKMLRGMAYNDGHGPKNQKLCDQIADRFDVWLEHHAGGATIPCEDVAVNSKGRFVDLGSPGGQSPYEVSDEHLKQWVEFLRNCGGFKVC